MRYPKKQGRIATNRQGRILLTNPDGKTFNVHATVAYIWENCTGDTPIPGLAKKYLQELEIPEAEGQGETDNMLMTLRMLEKNNLIEYIER